MEMITENICSICTEVMQNPYKTTCNHDFCTVCIDQWTTTKISEGVDVCCPLCRSVLIARVEGVPRHDWSGRPEIADQIVEELHWEEEVRSWEEFFEDVFNTPEAQHNGGYAQTENLVYVLDDDNQFQVYVHEADEEVDEDDENAKDDWEYDDL